MVSLAEQRRGAEHLEAKHGVSERRACQVIGIARSSKRRPSGRIEEARLVRRVHELTQRYPRFGYRKIFTRLRGEGFALGRERLRLIRKREGLQVPRKQKSGVARETARRKSIVRSTRTTYGATTSCWIKRSMDGGFAS